MELYTSPDSLFFDTSDFALPTVIKTVDEALRGTDDGELYCEYGLSDMIVLDDGVIKTATSDISHGFGLRGVVGEKAVYAHSSVIDIPNLNQAADHVRAVTKGYAGVMSIHPPSSKTTYYAPKNPLNTMTFDKRVAIMHEIDAYVRRADARVKQVTLRLSAEWVVVSILRAGGMRIDDIRPMVTLIISLVLIDKDKSEPGFASRSLRGTFDDILNPGTWLPMADHAIQLASVNLKAKPCPAGEFPVVLAAGGPAILLHEAVGHGLEGDFNRKKTSAYAGRMGQQVAAKGVTIYDDGTVNQGRGSLNVDDEGTPTRKTILIDEGILVGYMQDRMNARLMGVQPTGNGRRESYQHLPMPRMTNTYMDPGTHSVDDMIKSVSKGIYAVQFMGGSVDITSGQFNFSACEAYMIENGKITYPVKGATLIGNGPEVMSRVTMIGKDAELFKGTGSCGKKGQTVPVGLGQPTMLVSKMAVGGTQN